MITKSTILRNLKTPLFIIVDIRRILKSMCDKLSTTLKSQKDFHSIVNYIISL